MMRPTFNEYYVKSIGYKCLQNAFKTCYMRGPIARINHLNSLPFNKSYYNIINLML